MLAPDAANLKSSALQMANSGRFYAVDGDGIRANVDADTGRVRTLFIARLAPAAATISISPGQALAAAKAYLKVNRITEVGQAPTVTLVDRGDTTEYVVEWRTRVNGAWVPDTRSVSVNPATGEVFALQNQARAYETPPTALVSESKASQRAAAALGWDSPILQSAELYVSYDKQGPQRLVWVIKLADLGGHSASVFVDAMSGEPVVDSRG